MHQFLEFTITPTSQTVAIGEQATFRCQHTVAHIVYWRFDGNTVGSHPPSGISRSTSEERDSTVLILMVSGNHEYNGSMIECVAAFLNGSSEETNPAYLTGIDIQNNYICYSFIAWGDMVLIFLPMNCAFASQR